MPKTIQLTKRLTLEIKPKAPFNFEATYKPSHFETPLEKYENGRYWITMRFLNKMLGLKMWSVGSIKNPKVKIAVYSNSKLTKKDKEKLIAELNWRLGFNEDITEFIKIAKKDSVLKKPLKNLYGMRVTAIESLYDLLMITIVLQNANVKRTRAMLNNLLERFGKKVKFDGVELRVFFTPRDVVKAKKREIDACRLGYRDKFVRAISKSFLRKEIKERKLRSMSKEEAKKELMKLMGIGEYAAGIILFEKLRHYSELVLDIWNTPIFAKALFGRESQDGKKVLKEAEKRWGKFKGLAGLYILEDLFWKEKVK